MAATASDTVLFDTFGPAAGPALRAKQALMVVLGIALLAASAKVQVFLPGTPVPITMTTFGVLTVGAAYGARLGLITVLGYLALGALGASVFAGQEAGLTYMMGGTGGYLVGYALAAAALGHLARRGWDRSIGLMALAMVIGNALIYVPGLLWLHQFASGWAQTLEWGITPFLVGDALKLVLAALLVPGLWKLMGRARG
ncbi:MAG: biotin transporter BioY [Salibaculum sp.]|jgi:biotin transport system substrate-specific component|uniref:biotin transporter BioY n=1 Tax=Roseovarius halophilus (ex Wu et al. 2025) TaxID=3376060 RepID=UPI00287030AD|nr:biotin transporter BioY [Salibaculum sp.]MDR9428010.1 biotin transporter BioY [Salibaculum sp.]MDR9482912.1 biotin transporter BioY [Salibaculum sp.]